MLVHINNVLWSFSSCKFLLEEFFFFFMFFSNCLNTYTVFVWMYCMSIYRHTLRAGLFDNLSRFLVFFFTILLRHSLLYFFRPTLIIIPPTPVFKLSVLNTTSSFHPPLHLLPGMFALNETTGVISTARPLDYEANSSFILKVEADSMRVASSNFRAPSKSECTAPLGHIRDRFTTVKMVHLRTSPLFTSLSLAWKKYYSFKTQKLQLLQLFAMNKGPVRKTYRSVLWFMECNASILVYHSPSASTRTALLFA